MDARRTGAFIAELRNDKGWKQKDLASILQVSDKPYHAGKPEKGFQTLFF
ncbi:MAG: helix-turn-helix transcriptional regulator [Lachnospiraceae bacterium]|nr:helix-turn-helix transcriptional regulator [Lachnospiraceae bacterium]